MRKAMTFMREHPDWSDSPPELYADWIALSAFIVARPFFVNIEWNAQGLPAAIRCLASSALEGHNQIDFHGHWFSILSRGFKLPVPNA